MDLAGPEQPDLSLQLPRDVHFQLIDTLRAALAPITGSPQDHARRDNAFIAQIACLLPANADEANLAAQYVAAGARALDCLRVAQEYSTADHSFSLECGAHGARMMREARSARSMLLRVKASQVFGQPV